MAYSSISYSRRNKPLTPAEMRQRKEAAQAAAARRRGTGSSIEARASRDQERMQEFAAHGRRQLKRAQRASVKQEPVIDRAIAARAQRDQAALQKWKSIGVGHEVELVAPWAAAHTGMKNPILHGVQDFDRPQPSLDVGITHSVNKGRRGTVVGVHNWKNGPTNYVVDWGNGRWSILGARSLKRRA